MTVTRTFDLLNRYAMFLSTLTCSGAVRWFAQTPERVKTVIQN
jgi:hypothetical protein